MNETSKNESKRIKIKEFALRKRKLVHQITHTSSCYSFLAVTLIFRA